MASLVDWLAYSGARKSDGTVVASGYAYFYQPDTVSTQTTVYSDEDGLVAITQPLQLDASGRGIAYLKTPAKIQVRDSTGVTVIEVEDRSNTVNAAQVEVENSSWIGTHLVSGTQTAGGRTDLDTILTRIGTSVGGTDGKYKESTGATARNMNAAIGQFVTLEDFGGAGDNTTDNTTAFASAITRCIASGKPLKLEAGTYRVTGAIAISGASSPGFRIYGSTRGESIIRQMGTAVDTLTFDTGAGSEGHVELRDFRITANTTTSGTAIKFTAGYAPVISNVAVALHRVGFDVSGSSWASLQNCVVESTDSNAAGFGYRLGTYGTAYSCRYSASSTGTAFSFDGSFGRAVNCHVNSAATGFSLASSHCQAVSCNVTTCTTGFSVGAVAGSGCMSCYSVSGATSDFTTNAAATLVIDAFNTFTTRTHGEYGGLQLGTRGLIRTRYKQNVSGGTWTPDPSRGELQIANMTSGSNFTIGATATAGLSNGQPMTLVVENPTATAGVTVTWNAQYVGLPTNPWSVAASINANNTHLLHFTWNSTSSKWVYSGGTPAASLNAGAALW